MDRLNILRSTKSGVLENENSSAKCKIKIDFPPVSISQDFGKTKPERLNDTIYNQNSKGKLGFQCHFEERMKRTENRRKKIIQKLKENYKIDLEGLNEKAKREIVLKAEMIEREKKQKEKRKTERMVNMLSRLLEEEKYKNQGRLSLQPWSKNMKGLYTFKRPRALTRTRSKTLVNVHQKDEVKTETSDEKSMIFSELEAPGGDSKGREKEETCKIPSDAEKDKTLDFLDVLSYSESFFRPKLLINFENSLESTPKCVKFNDYKKNKVYIQHLQIRTLSSEPIHCRYAGIIVHTKCEERFPIGVAVRDNVKLRPGLDCSTKIRLCSKDDKKELKFSIVYETRRQKNPSQRNLFFVPVICLPVRAIVKVIPLKITYPALTWCEATDPKDAKLLIKYLKIENSGAKACSCRISKTEFEIEDECVENYGGEMDYLGNKSHNSEGSSSSNGITYAGEFEGEGYLPILENSEGIVESLLNEILGFVCSTFQFSKIFNIEIPPFSTTQIQVKFTPLYKGFHYEKYQLQFEDCDNCTEKSIEIIGNIKQIPLRVKPELIDLKICISNSGVYAGTFKVFNETKGNYSVVLKIPPSLKKHAHVYPRGSTILPLKSCDFSVRIYPRITLAKDAPRYYNEKSHMLEFPVFIYPVKGGVCKRDCVKVYVLAMITNYHLTLSPSFINFGFVTTLETVRTELELTNHSLAIQDFGFLNLPKGVRVEPNFGFGQILPKETIKLYLLYSPGEDLVKDKRSRNGHEFQVTVTSIAKYGGFKEKLKFEENSLTEATELLWGEDYNFELENETSSITDSLENTQTDSEDFDVCEEGSSTEGEEYCSKLFQEENKIREFLHQDVHKLSEDSDIKKTSTLSQNVAVTKPSVKISKPKYLEDGEYEELKSFKTTSSGVTSSLSTVHCQAFVIQPRCRLSATVIQLPATSYSSFSLFRFRLYCNKEEENINCHCGYRKVVKCEENYETSSSFEFKYNCPHIKLEPQSGYIKAGEDIPITIVFRPEYPGDQFQKEVKSKTQISASESRSVTLITSNTKKTVLSSKSKVSISSKITSVDTISVVASELDKSELNFTEKNLSKYMKPFSVEAEIQCVVKTKFSEDEIEKSEVHKMIVICPVIQPNFIYLGNSREINFNKVFLGTRSRKILQIQSNSLERISPSATLLNPFGPFFCPAGISNVQLDPEHIWQQPLVFAPLKENGVEKQFFEIYCGTTNILLMVTGEGIRPKYTITPNFEYCLIETSPGRSEELKLDIENLSEIPLNIYIEIDLEKKAPMSEKIPKPQVVLNEEPKREKKRPKPIEGENFQFWEETPAAILSLLANFTDIDPHEKAFTLAGVDGDNKIEIPPSENAQIKIQFQPPDDKSGRSLAIKYSFMLEKVSLLKEILILGRINKGTQKLN